MTTTYGILSTYPPTQCGLATFSAALVGALDGPHDLVEVVAVADDAGEHDGLTRGGAAHVWVKGAAGGTAATADALNGYDVAIVQHEYGIFGGPDGEDVLAVVRALTVPVVVVLHTVLTTPTLRQRAILDELVLRADAVVTMTRTARERLLEHYAAPAAPVHVVPHGAVGVSAVGTSTVTLPVTTRDEDPSRRPVVLTWGLLGPGKGIEWAIEAMAGLRDLDPQPLYRVVGETHPKVVEAEGERYRRLLEARVAELGVADLVEFVDRYLATDDIRQLAREADIVLLPYDSLEQVTSGVLVEAVTAGRPVVATGFPHARELLASGAGIVVERQDPAALADALRHVLVEPARSSAMAAEATRIAPDLLWSAVAESYRQLAEQVLAARSERLSA